jgi:hypothetical protein
LPLSAEGANEARSETCGHVSTSCRRILAALLVLFVARSVALLSFSFFFVAEPVQSEREQAKATERTEKN